MLEVSTYPVAATECEIAAARSAAEHICAENNVTLAEVWAGVQASLYKSQQSHAAKIWTQMEEAASQEIGLEVVLRYSPADQSVGA